MNATIDHLRLDTTRSCYDVPNEEPLTIHRWDRRSAPLRVPRQTSLPTCALRPRRSGRARARTRMTLHQFDPQSIQREDSHGSSELAAVDAVCLLVFSLTPSTERRGHNFSPAAIVHGLTNFYPRVVGGLQPCQRREHSNLRRLCEEYSRQMAVPPCGLKRSVIRPQLQLIWR